MKYCKGCGRYRVDELMLGDLSGCYVCKAVKYKEENPDFSMLPKKYKEKKQSGTADQSKEVT